MEIIEAIEKSQANCMAFPLRTHLGGENSRNGWCPLRSPDLFDITHGLEERITKPLCVKWLFLDAWNWAGGSGRCVGLGTARGD